MKTNFKLLLFLIFFTSKLLAQNSSVILSSNFIVNEFLYSLPISTIVTSNGSGYQGQPAKKSQNIQVDATGKITFFIVDGMVYDRKGRAIGAINQTSDGKCGETVILPSPDNCKNSFFLLTTYSSSGGVVGGYASFDHLTISYDVFDNLMPGSGLRSTNEINQSTYDADNYKIATLVGSLFTVGETSGGGGHGSFPLFASSKVLSGNKRFVYVYNAPYLFRLKIQNEQLVYDNYALDIRTLYSNQAITAVTSRQEMELVSLSDGTLRIAIPVINLNGSRAGYTVLDMNGTTGAYITSSKKTIEYNYGSAANAIYIKGAEFSSTGNKLYLSHNSTTPFPSTLDVFDLTTLTRSVVSTISDFKDSQIEAGKVSANDVLLIPSSSQLYQITSPNTTPSVVNYQTLTGYNAICSTYPTSCSDPRLNVRLMQDQIDGENYITYSTTDYTLNTYSATTSATWSLGSNPFGNTSGIVYVKESIIVPAGVSITVSGMEFRFSKNARFIVENSTNSLEGGRVFLINSTFDSGEPCGTSSTWRGVEVRGSSSQVQGNMSSSKQGRFQMQNSLLTRAEIGVVAMAYTKNVSSSGAVSYTALSNRSGGIVQMIGSRLVNNQTDVYLASYSNPNNLNNTSSFSDTRFVTDLNFNTLSAPLNQHMQLINVQGVSIKGCDFVNSDPSLFPNYTGIGIFSMNSTFFVEKRCTTNVSNCTPTDPNIFEGLTYGIYIYDFIGSEMAYKVSGNLFRNNWVGIRSQTNTSGSILENEFQILRADQFTQTSGVYFQNCDRYQIEGNKFTFDPLTNVPLSQTNTYGIVVDNSGMQHNSIYRNTFDGLVIGGQSERVNGSLINENSPDPLSTGLQWKCNIFKNTRDHDLAVVNGLIDYHQGYFGGVSLSDAYNNSARNSFSLVGENPASEHDIIQMAATQRINYVHLGNGDQTPDSYTINGPTVGVNINAQVYGGNVLMNTEGICPSKIRKPILLLQSELSTNEEKYENAQAQYQTTPSEITANAYNASLSQFSESKNALSRAYIQDSIDRSEAYFTFVKDYFGVKKHDQLYLEFLLAKGDNENINQALSTSNLSNEYKSYFEILRNLKDVESILFMQQNNPSMVSELSILMNQTVDLETAKLAKALYELIMNEHLAYSFLRIDSGAKPSDDAAILVNNSEKESLIYPNPVSKTLFVQVDLKQEETISATVFTVLGAEVGSWTLSNESNSFDVSNLQNGVYIIHLTNATNDFNKVVRFVKK